MRDFKALSEPSFLLDVAKIRIFCKFLYMNLWLFS